MPVVTAERTHATHHGHGARIGPNAIIRVAEALRAFEGQALSARVFRTAGLDHYLDAPPQQMVDECDVIALHRALVADVGQVRAASVSWIAGQRTADYLLENRIPIAAQRLMKALPAHAASIILLTAISRNAWTFSGSGHFTYRFGNPARVSIANCPVCRGAHAASPACTYFAATFERLYSVLVHPDTRVVERTCMALGAPACTFDISW